MILERIQEVAEGAARGHIDADDALTAITILLEDARHA